MPLLLSPGIAELEQVGCGYSEAYLGQNLDPYLQADKAAGLITYDDAVFMFENLVHPAERDQLLLRGEGRPAELGRPGTEHHPRRATTEDGGRRHRGDGLRHPRCVHALPLLPPAAAVPVPSPRRPRAGFLEKVLDCNRHRRGHAPVRQCRRHDEAGPAPVGLHRATRSGISPWARPAAPVSGRAWGATSPTRRVTPWKDSPTLERLLELTLNNGYRPAHQDAGRARDRRPRESFKDLRGAVQRPSRQQLQFTEDVAPPGGLDLATC